MNDIYETDFDEQDNPDRSRSDETFHRRVAGVLLALLGVVVVAILATLLFLGGDPDDGGVAQPGSPSPSPTPPHTLTPELSPSPTPVVTPSPSPLRITPTLSPIPPATPSAAPTSSAPPLDEKTPPPATPSPAPPPPGQLTPAPVAGDDADAPIPVNVLPYTITIDTTNATTGSTDPNCDGTGPTVWFEFIPSVSTSIAATTFGSSYDTTLYLAQQRGPGQIDLLECNDDAGHSVQSAIRFEATAGTRYLLMVGSFGGWSGGQLVFNLGVAAPPPAVTVSIDPEGTFDVAGRATIAGVAQCSSRIGSLEIGVHLRQRVDRVIVQGWRYITLEPCDSELRQWSAVISSDEYAFGDEPAEVTLDIWFCDAFSCSSQQVHSDVTLVSSAPSPSPSPSPPPSPSPSPADEPTAATPPADPTTSP